MIEFLEDYLVKQKEQKVFKLNGQAVLHSSAEAYAGESRKWPKAVGFEECGIIAGCNDGGIGEIFLRKILRAK